jgi:hypothetical protein
MPDLASVEVSGNPDRPLQVQVVRFSDPDPGVLIDATATVAEAGENRPTLDANITAAPMRNGSLIEQNGKVVSAGHTQTNLNKGESGNLATLCAVIPARDTYSVSADVRVVGAIKALDSRNCRYTAP